MSECSPHSGYALRMPTNKKDYEHDYTHPQLREQLKEEIKDSNKGGAPGQWSARKSQLLTQEYEKHGGGYRRPDRPTTAQQELAEWTEQQWQTESGSAHARHGDVTERYLPENAWRELSRGQRRKTQQAKQDQSRRGRQHAANPPAAKSARKLADLDVLPAREAAKVARRMSARDAEDALHHERKHKGRKTVLRELDKAVDRGQRPESQR